MNSRERVEKVLSHQMPDYIPNGWGGCETAGMHVLAYRELVSALGLTPRAPRVDTFMFNAVFDLDVIAAMQGDVLLLASPNMCSRELRAQKGWRALPLFGTEVVMTDDHAIETDGDGMTYLLRNGQRIARCPKGGAYFDGLSGGNLLEGGDVPDPSGYHPSHSLPEEKLRQLEEAAKRAYEETELSLCMGESILDLQGMPGGMLSWYDAMINEPDIVEEYLTKMVDAALDQITQLDQAVGKYCSMLSIAHDLGDSRGVTMGPNRFRQCYKKHYYRLFHGWHQRTGMKVNLHSCGSIAEIIPDLIECGVDVLNPVQISGRGMSPEALRQMAGDRLVLYGGCFDCIQTPPSTPEEEVYRQVKQNIETLSRGGGYLFAGVHNTPANTPQAHIRAVLRAYEDTKRM